MTLIIRSLLGGEQATDKKINNVYSGMSSKRSGAILSKIGRDVTAGWDSTYTDQDGNPVKPKD